MYGVNDNQVSIYVWLMEMFVFMFFGYMVAILFWYAPADTERACWRAAAYRGIPYAQVLGWPLGTTCQLSVNGTNWYTIDLATYEKVGD